MWVVKGLLWDLFNIGEKKTCIPDYVITISVSKGQAKRADAMFAMR